MHHETGAEVALKAIARGQRHTERYRRFAVEIATLTSLGDFPGVLGIVDGHLPRDAAADDQPWLAMPIARPIRAALRDAPLYEVVGAVAAIADTLARLAELGIAHRDVKPGNLFWRDGAWLVGDFGHVALPARDGSGTVRWPGDRVDRGLKADVYALAHTLVVLATTRRRPASGVRSARSTSLVADHHPDCHADLVDALIDRCTRLDPDARPPMREVARELAAWLALVGAVPASVATSSEIVR